MEAYNVQRDKRKIIDYEPKELRRFKVFAYEWIDNLCFTINPNECLPDPDKYIQIVREIFLEAGWYGDGDIELMWIPPFMFDGVRTMDFTAGVTVWHVKQKEDGISWVLYPAGIFDNLTKEQFG